ncbi:hypothetical protein [Streptomyces sp. RKAG337]|uniref:hypothetical protein n=1 Tax=Streptomyces sp. RKAG337 TaxID=2893404 RepID=UPI002033ACDF|nr:hypothetical protein [Streptomyces sp. RKAG337]MCM2431046.1 hypothetical protein [Streptomyces sp. RKAG337]
MATAQQPTSAQHRRVQWKPLDRVLARYSTESLLVVLHAALASPGCSRFGDHLLLLWTRVLRTPSRPGDQAGAGDLPGLVEAAVRAAPGRGTVTEAEPNDPRALVAFEVAAERLLVHPGQLDHPLMFLRSAQLTALAVDEPLLSVHGFTLTDVLELVLRYSDHAVTALAPAWPQAYEDRVAQEIACGISPGEAEAAQELAGLDPAMLTGACRNPQRAERALQWLTADLADLPLRYHPTRSLLGPVLAVVAHGRRRLVPVCAVLNTFAAALEHLLAAVPDPQGAQERLQELTADRVAQLLGLDEAPAKPGRVCVISSPGYRYDIAVVSALSDGGLSGRIEEGRSALAASGAPGRGRLVVYGGPRVLGPELITDTAYLHLEELAEILADAEGDPATVALFVLELTEHPGVDAVFYREPLDAWTAWRRESTLLLPAPDRQEVAAVPPAGFDPSWQRAATWARTDDVLAAAGLPQALHWRFAHLAEPDPGLPGEHADLLYPGSDGGELMVRISTVPPLTVIANPCPEPGAVLDLAAMTGLADSIRTTITRCPPVTAHFTLPDGAPVVLQLTETTQPHQPPPTDPDSRPADEQEAGERLLLHAGAQPDQARIGVDLDPPLLASFTGDGQQGHRILGRLLHHLVAQVRQGRGAGPGTDPEEFAEAWDAAYPVLRITGNATYWPATTPHYTLPRSHHLHARVLRTAAAAIRRARVPAGSWHGTDAYGHGGPAEQLLHALEDELTQQIRAHQPDLVEELARQLNAAWSSRTRGHHEVEVNLAAPWGANWAPEAGRRQAGAATATSALQLLLQQAIATPPAGQRPVDVLAVAELVALAELVRHCGTTAVAASRRLHDLHLDIHPTGVFTLTDTNEAGTADPGAELAHLGFNAEAYQQARQQHFLAQAATATPQLRDESAAFAARGSRTATVFAAPDLPPGSQLARADRLLHQQWGFGFAALGAVLASAADWPTGPDGIAMLTPEDLVREATAWSALPTADLTAAVDRLRLHPGNAAATGPHAYTEVERRTRPATHPLITHDGRLLVLPWLIHTAQNLYAAYLDEGRLPHPDLPQPVTDALRRHRQHLDDRLEADLKTIARDAGLPHKFRLLEKTAAQLGIPGLIGEIDLLVADPAARRLWVIEAKNPHGAVAPHNLVQHLQRFDRYCTKLLAKTATITAHASQAARACQAPEGMDWNVVPLMVTRTLEPAGFLADPKVPFTIADHLAQILADPASPHPGWNSPNGQPNR